MLLVVTKDRTKCIIPGLFPKFTLLTKISTNIFHSKPLIFFFFWGVRFEAFTFCASFCDYIFDKQLHLFSTVISYMKTEFMILKNPFNFTFSTTKNCVFKNNVLIILPPRSFALNVGSKTKAFCVLNCTIVLIQTKCVPRKISCTLLFK